MGVKWINSCCFTSNCNVFHSKCVLVSLSEIFLIDNLKLYSLDATLTKHRKLKQKTAGIGHKPLRLKAAFNDCILVGKSNYVGSVFSCLCNCFHGKMPDVEANSGVAERGRPASGDTIS